VRSQILALDPATYRPHHLHDSDRTWTETNCYVDLWVEVLHALGLEPLAAGAFALASDFLGDQWTFFKHPPEDLRALYGIDVGELTVWRPLSAHIVEHLARRELLTVEVDAWHLPDTAGVSYRSEHVKTTIVPQMIDPEAEVVGYFHNSGYHELSGDDYRALLPTAPEPSQLPPYVELVRLDGTGPKDAAGGSPADLVEAARALARGHLARRPTGNPVRRWAERLAADVSWLLGAGAAVFHPYAFATCRQCGAAAEMAASFVAWLEAAEASLGRRSAGDAAATATGALLEIAAGAKTLQFTLARIASGRASDPAGLLERMAASWDVASAALGECYGS
jgi:hypothetical protein